MELVKNIFFNIFKLLQNSTVKISYTGYLFENNSEKVYIHYGYGDNWDNVNELEMNKTELGYQVDIDLPETNKLNFCFRNSSNEWDNNLNANYTFEVEKPELSLISTQENSLEKNRSKGLRKTYIWNKKIRLAVYKILKFFPRLVSGNYKKKADA